MRRVTCRQIEHNKFGCSEVLVELFDRMNGIQNLGWTSATGQEKEQRAILQVSHFIPSSFAW